MLQTFKPEECEDHSSDSTNKGEEETANVMHFTKLTMKVDLDKTFADLKNMDIYRAET